MYSTYHCHFLRDVSRNVFFKLCQQNKLSSENILKNSYLINLYIFGIDISKNIKYIFTLLNNYIINKNLKLKIYISILKLIVK